MKITKKAIKESPEFIIGIDYKASYKSVLSGIRAKQYIKEENENEV